MNAFMSIEHDYSTPMIERVSRAHIRWYERNKEKVLEDDKKRRIRNSGKLQINPKWRKAFGGI